MDTVRIGIIYPESSHADRYSELANLPKEQFPKTHVEGARVVGLWGEDPKRNRELVEKYGIDFLADRPEDLIGRIDLAIPTARHAGRQPGLARPFIEAGIPTFVDKPCALTLAEGRKLSQLARRHGTPITSFSTYRIGRSTRRIKTRELKKLGKFTFGEFTGPGKLVNEHGGLIFYGIHAVELALEFMGPGAEEVYCAAHGGNVASVLRWDGERSATVNVLGNAAYVFHVSLYGPGGHYAAVPESASLYHDGLQVAVEMARTRKEPLAHEVFLESLAVIDAMNASIASGRPEKVARI